MDYLITTEDKILYKWLFEFFLECKDLNTTKVTVGEIFEYLKQDFFMKNTHFACVMNMLGNLSADGYITYGNFVNYPEDTVITILL